jgi:hypothetical protein
MFFFGERGNLLELIYKLTNSMIVYERIIHHELIFLKPVTSEEPGCRQRRSTEAFDRFFLQ